MADLPGALDHLSAWCRASGARALSRACPNFPPRSGMPARIGPAGVGASGGGVCFGRGGVAALAFSCDGVKAFPRGSRCASAC